MFESETTKRHKAEAPKKLNFAVIVCSTSRYEEIKAGKTVEDPSGELIAKLLEGKGHKIVFKKIVPDNSAMIRIEVKNAISEKDIDAIIVCGGTGISPSDVTIETVEQILEKTLPGFGEIFRWLSYQEIGSAAILTRALAGTVDGKAVFCIPGSPQAVRLSVEKLILPEAAHIVKHAREKPWQ
jgi:molybdenum cofactor biosynthesis protein B